MFIKQKELPPSKTLMVDTLGAITSSNLTKLNCDETLDSNWFNIPAAGAYKAPEAFKTGTFRYLSSNDDAKVVREKTKQIEIAGKSKKSIKLNGALTTTI